MNRLACLVSLALVAACGPMPNNPGSGGPCNPLKADTLGSGGHVTAGCYDVDATIDVTANTLTLDPGVTLKFASGASFIIEANAILTAVGTKTKPIVLTGQQATPGYWMGLGYQGSKSQSNRLSYVTLEDAGSGNWTGASDSTTALFVGDQSQMEMDHSTIEHSGGAGFLLYSSAKVDFHDDTVTTCTVPGISGPPALDGVASSNTLTGNTHDYVEINDVDLTRDTTWHALDVPILQPATTWTDIHNNATLTLEAGLSVEFGSDAHLNAESDGTLVANGTKLHPVILIGKEKTPGYWRGVRLNSPASLTYTYVEYAGSSAFTGSADTVADVFLDNFLGTGSLTADHVYLNHSAGYGLYVESGATVTGCGTITFAANAKGKVGGTMTGTDCPP